MTARYLPQLTCDGCGRQFPGAPNEVVPHLRTRAARFGWTSYTPHNMPVAATRDRCRNCSIVAAQLHATPQE